MIFYDLRGDETSESSAKQVRNNGSGNGHISDYQLWVITPWGGRKKSLEILIAESCRETADNNKISNNKES